MNHVHTAHIKINKQIIPHRRIQLKVLLWHPILEKVKGLKKYYEFLKVVLSYDEFSKYAKGYAGTEKLEMLKCHCEVNIDHDLGLKACGLQNI